MFVCFGLPKVRTPHMAELDASTIDSAVSRFCNDRLLIIVYFDSLTEGHFLA